MAATGHLQQNQAMIRSKTPPRPSLVPEVEHPVGEQAALASANATTAGHKRWRTLSSLEHVSELYRSINYVDPLFWHMQEVRGSSGRCSSNQMVLLMQSVPACAIVSCSWWSTSRGGGTRRSAGEGSWQ